MSGRPPAPTEAIRQPEPLELYTDLLRRSIVFTDPNGLVDHIDSFADARSPRRRFLVVRYRTGEMTMIRIVERAGVGGYAVTVSSRVPLSRD